jgi:hypothetical protein
LTLPVVGNLGCVLVDLVNGVVQTAPVPVPALPVR